MADIDVVNPKEYILESIDNLNDNVKYCRRDLILRNVYSYTCIIISYLIKNDSFIFTNPNLFKTVSSFCLGAAGLNLVSNAFKYNDIANMEEEADTLQEQLDLQDISFNAADKVHDAKKYLVKKMEDVNSKGCKKYATAKVMLLASGVAMLMMMLSSNGYILDTNGYLIVGETILAYLCANRCLEMGIDSAKDDRIVARINNTLNLHEIKRTKKLPK